MFKKIIIKLLQGRVKSYFKHHPRVKLVVITGSVGKTTTKLSIATVLSKKYRVLVHQGNHNTHFSVPTSLLNIAYPSSVKNPFAWIRVLWQMQVKILKKAEYDVVVQEFGTDQPGDIKEFSYLRPEIAVVTAVSPEHMEFFKNIEAVANEELSVAGFSKQTFINQDDVDPVFLQGLSSQIGYISYGLTSTAEYNFALESKTSEGFLGTLNGPEFGSAQVVIKTVSEPALKAATAAAGVAAKLGVSAQQIIEGVQGIAPVAGRLQLLPGLLGSTIIDDTYNSSPLALQMALKTLQNYPATQRIAILGSMNELGAYSQEAHATAGDLCDPSKLDWVVTIGQDARRYLATEAAANGCQVKSFNSPYDAGSFIHSVLKEGAVILAKGSQNGVFAEEALKILLHNPEDTAKLVRQSPDWIKIKQAQFKDSKILL